MAGQFRRGVDRLVEDLRSGENLDLYVAIFASFTIVFLNLFGLVAEKYVTQLNLVILCILSYTILGLRHAMRELKETLKPPVVRPVFTSEFPADFRESLENATEIWFSGIHLGSTLTAYHDLIVRKLKRKGKLRFLLVDPEGSAAILATKRFSGEVKEDQEANRIRQSLATLSKLKSDYPNNIQIRVIDFPIEYTTFFMNPSSKNPKLFVERATYKISGGIHKPKFIYDKGDGLWFSHIEKEIQLQWEDARVWPIR